MGKGRGPLSVSDAAPASNRLNGAAIADERSGGRHFIPAIDTLRLFAAAWVVLYHGAAPPLDLLVPQHWAQRAAQASRLPFNGNAAVVLFFVISGFCIHLGHAGKRTLDWQRFLAQRAARLLPPMLVMIAGTAALGDAYQDALETVLWSVYCELAYYAAYPMLFPALQRAPRALLLVAAAGTLVGAGLYPTLTFLWEFGWYTPVYCLPMWLIGCWLADRFVADAALPVARLWPLRIGAVLYGSAAAIASHLPAYPIGYIWTMPPFAMLCAWWIWNEVGAARRYGASVSTERLGRASYSIYLVHKPAMVAATSLGTSATIIWPAKLVAVVLASAIFYVVVERPAHVASRQLGRLMRRRATDRRGE